MVWYTVYRNLNLIQNKSKRISLTVLSAVPISCYLYFLSAHLSASPEEPVSRLWCCSFISFRNLGASDWNLRLVWWRWMFLLAVTHGMNPSSINFMWLDVKLKMCWEIAQTFFHDVFQLGLACAWLVLTDSRGSRRGRRSRGRAAASRGRRSLRGPSRGGTKSADTARAGRQRTLSEMCAYEWGRNVFIWTMWAWMGIWNYRNFADLRIWNFERSSFQSFGSFQILFIVFTRPCITQEKLKGDVIKSLISNLFHVY